MASLRLHRCRDATCFSVDLIHKIMKAYVSMSAWYEAEAESWSCTWPAATGLKKQGVFMIDVSLCGPCCMLDAK